jgi:hypothetical protein
MKALSLGRLGLGVLAVVLTVGAAIAANDLTLSTGTKFLPGPRMIDGNDLNVMLATVNLLNDRSDGTAPLLPSCAVTGSGTAATCNGVKGVVTTAALTTAALTEVSYTITNSSVTANSVVQCTNQGYSGVFFTAGVPEILSCVPGASSIVVHLANTHATVALNGTVKIGFRVNN